MTGGLVQQAAIVQRIFAAGRIIVIKPVQLQQDQDPRNAFEDLRSEASIPMYDAPRGKRGPGSIQFNTARALPSDAHQFNLCASSKDMIPAFIASEGDRLRRWLKREPGTVYCL